MAQRNIDFGSFPDDPNADAIRTAFDKVQQNFTELFNNRDELVYSVNRTPGAGITVNSPTGNVVVTANIAQVRIQSSTLDLSAGVPGVGTQAIINQGTVPIFINLPANLAGVANINLTGTLVANTVNVSLQINGNTASFTGNITTSTNLNASNVFTQQLTVDANANVNGNLNVLANANVSANVNAANINTSGLVVATGNITGGNLVTGGALSVTGNANVGNLGTAGLITANNANISANVNANVVNANYLYGDGSNISGVTKIFNGTSYANIPTSGGNLNIVVDANAALTVSSTGANIARNLDVLGITSLGLIGNVKITGGALGKFIGTDGTGNLSFSTVGEATNVLYVSKSGNDANDGVSLNTAKLTIAAAAAIATPGTTIFVKAGDYTEANPMSLAARVTIVGDNLRAVTVRPANPTQDIFWARPGCYITGITFRGHLHPSAAVAFPKVIFIGSISGTTLTVTAMSTAINDIRVGTFITGTGIATDTVITALGTGTGGTGTYTVNNSQTVSSTTLTGAVFVTTSPYVQNCSSIASAVRETVAAGNFVTGYTYNILSVGTTDFTAIGAASNTVGVEFTATGPGTGDGTAYLVVGCGMRIDGTYALGLKSMVVDAFTQYNQGGKGIHILNSGYAQLVSVFTICTSIGIHCESGGQCSVSNSNNSFGDYALWADGTSPELYSGVTDLFINGEVTVSGLSERPAVNDTFQFDGQPTQWYTVHSASELVGGVSVIQFDQPPGDTPTAGTPVKFYQPSFISASGQTFEYVGTGTDILTSTPRLGGVPDTAKEVIQVNGGIVNWTSTDQFGDFRVGTGLVINEEAGTISGPAFEKGLFAVLTPYILALEN